MHLTCTCLATGHFCPVNICKLHLKSPCGYIMAAYGCVMAMCPMGQPRESIASLLLLQLLCQPGDNKHVCGSYDSVGFLSASHSCLAYPEFINSEIQRYLVNSVALGIINLMGLEAQYFFNFYFWRWRTRGREGGVTEPESYIPLETELHLDPWLPAPKPAFLLDHSPEIASDITAQKTGQRHAEGWIQQMPLVFSIFSKQFKFFHRIWNTMCARCTGCLALWHGGDIYLLKR